MNLITKITQSNFEVPIRNGKSIKNSRLIKRI